eukprot:TRINITY_DN29146_c0_g1_i1.p1 TRINITY_DN29146_c0_g1~~TRINITY_DN29146_c0_g1_i1.p1  ORF type:complete len:452 (-),score=75.18 TRINITY_DN29146_c0_g1_i1:93-1388(-)
MAVELQLRLMQWWDRHASARRASGCLALGLSLVMALVLAVRYYRKRRKARDEDEEELETQDAAICPICLEDLYLVEDGNTVPVGALTQNGARVNASMYHTRCVAEPRISGTFSLKVCLLNRGRYVCPCSRAEVDGLVEMPALSNRLAWVSFIDWNREANGVTVSALAQGLAAAFPVHQHLIQEFFCKAFHLSATSFISQELIVDWILPYMEARNQTLQLDVLKKKAPPRLTQESTRREIEWWFDYWDLDGSGTLDAKELGFGMASLFTGTVSEDDHGESRLAVIKALSTCMGLMDRDKGPISKAEFVRYWAPSLLGVLVSKSSVPRSEAVLALLHLRSTFFHLGRTCIDLLKTVWFLLLALRTLLRLLYQKARSFRDAEVPGRKRKAREEDGEDERNTRQRTAEGGAAASSLMPEEEEELRELRRRSGVET